MFNKLIVLLLAFSAAASAQKPFPQPDMILKDAKHKEPKSGVQISGGSITIQQGVGTPSSINTLAFSGDGKFLAAAKDFGRVVVFDLGKREFFCAIETGQGIVHAVALSGDGKLLATGGEGDSFSVKLWSIPDGKLVRSFAKRKGYPREAFFGPGSSWLVVSDNGSTVSVLDVATGKSLLDLVNQRTPTLFPDGLMTMNSMEYSFWNTADWSTTPQKIIPRPPGNDWALAFDPKRDIGAIELSHEGLFRLVRFSTGERLPNTPSPEVKFTVSTGPGRFFSFTPDGQILFGQSERVWAWDQLSGKTCISEIMYSGAAALSADGTLLAASKDDGIMAQMQGAPRTDGVWIWNVANLASKCAFDKR